MMENSKEGETNALEISDLLGSSQSERKPSILTKCVESDNEKKNLWQRL